MFTPFNILCVGGVLMVAILVVRHIRVMRAAARPEIQAAVSWWTRTITAMAWSEGVLLAAGSKKVFADAVAMNLAKAFLKDGYYPSVSSVNSARRSPVLRAGIQAAGFPLGWIPADVAMLVYPDSVCVRCGTDREDHLQLVWTQPAA